MPRYESFENMAAAIQQGTYHELDDTMSADDETRDELNAQALLKVVSGDEATEEEQKN